MILYKESREGIFVAHCKPVNLEEAKVVGEHLLATGINCVMIFDNHGNKIATRYHWEKRWLVNQKTLSQQVREEVKELFR